MARTADLKRKRTVDDEGEESASKVARLEDGRRILEILDSQDSLGLLDELNPSLRTLLSNQSPLSLLKSAIQNLPSNSNFTNLALSLLDSQSNHPTYALLQHLPSADYWSSLVSLPSPSKLQTAKAELVAVLPSPSSSFENSTTTLGTYSSKSFPHKKSLHSHRLVSTGAFLNYGLFSSFAPSFDQDGELVGRRQLGQVLYYQEEKTRSRHAITTRPPTSIQEIPPDPPKNADFDSQLELETLLPPDQVKSLKAALNSLELENSVQKLLERNQRALERLEELQSQRLTNDPASNAEEGSEEWDTAKAVLDSLTILASLRPRESDNDTPTLLPPLSVLHKLHRTLALGPSPGWHGILPPGNTTALRDDSTIKVRPGVVAPTPVPPATAAAATVAPVANAFGTYPYPYTQQQQAYRPQPASYTPYKAGQTPSFYQGYVTPGTQQQQNYYSPQTYASGTANQQPYGATTAQQPYAGYSSWYTYPVQAGAGSGRGTPQPIAAAPTTVPSTYGGFFNTSGTRPPAVANTVVGNATAATSYSQTTTNPVPTLPVHLRPAQATNGSSTPYQQPHQNYYGTYPIK